MPEPWRRTRAWASSEKAATAVEYSLMIAAVALAIYGMVFALGGSVSGILDGITTSMPKMEKMG